MILDIKALDIRARRLGIVALAAGTAACTHPPSHLQVEAAPSQIVVVATTSTLASLVQAVAGSNITVHTLVPVGVSPETYEPTPADLIALSHAALVVENGAGLEQWLDKLIATAVPHAKVLRLSDAVIAQTHSAAQGHNAEGINPHFWLDPRYAQIYVAEVARALSSVDPGHATTYSTRAATETQRLVQFDAWTRAHIATIPRDHRAMLAFHDAWYYFDRRYGIRDVGVIESSPGKEPSAKELAALIALAKEEHVRAVFAEPEFSPRLAKQLADSAGITTVTDLYDDSLGTTPELSTYEGLMHHNVDTIVRALRP